MAINYLRCEKLSKSPPLQVVNPLLVEITVHQFLHLLSSAVQPGHCISSVWSVPFLFLLKSVWKWETGKTSHIQLTSTTHRFLSLLGFNGLFNPLTPKILLVILLTVCHIVLVTLVWRISYWIHKLSPS